MAEARLKLNQAELDFHLIQQARLLRKWGLNIGSRPICTFKTLSQLYTALTVLQSFDTLQVDNSFNWDNALGVAGFERGTADAELLRNVIGMNGLTEEVYSDIANRLLTYQSHIILDPFEDGYMSGFDHVSSTHLYEKMKEELQLNYDWPLEYTGLNEDQAQRFTQYCEESEQSLKRLL